MSKIIGDTACPKCREKGGDKTGNHLMLFADGGAYCNRCGFTAKDYDPDGDVVVPHRSRSVSSNSVDVTVIGTLPTSQINDRMISKDTALRYGVKMGMSETTGDVADHYYPYTKDGEITGYKHRRLPKQFSTVGDVKGCELFGQTVVGSDRKRLVITGGELDTLAAYQMLKTWSDRKYPGRGFEPAVVSLPKGESTQGIADNFEFIDGFSEIVICTDMDKTGRQAAEAIAVELARENVKIMSMSEKDACDMLLAGKAAEFVNDMFRAEEFTPEGFDPIELKELMTPRPEGYHLPYPELNHMIHGVRKGEIVLVTAGSGIGKSTLAREIGFSLMETHGLRVGNIFLEETQVDTMRTYIAMREEVSPVRLAMKPELIGEERMQAAADFYNERGVFLRHFGSLSDQKLIDRMRYMTKVRHCEFIILDHVSMVISGRDNSSQGERKDIDVLMTKLASFAVDMNVGIIIISHLSRGRERNWNAGDVPDLKDLRGSAALEQLSWTILAMARNQRGELPNMSTIHVLKNRTWGFVGAADTVVYSHETGRLEHVQDEEF